MRVENDTERFTIRDEDESTESIYISDAENLRIEKLNTRVTLVAILISCLLAIILAVAYIDIKNRVANTQNSGSMGVQNLSKDLESRFSSLSLKQAKLEAQFNEQNKKLENASAALQVNLKKTTTKFQLATEKKPDRSELTAISKKSKSAIVSLKKDNISLRDQMKDLKAAFTKFDEELASQILLMAKGFKKNQDRLAKMEGKTQALETEKLSKESMNLALGLERLALQEMIKNKIREVNKKMTSLDRTLNALARRLNEQSKNATPAPPATSSSGPVRAPGSQIKSPNIEEQTIN